MALRYCVSLACNHKSYTMNINDEKAIWCHECEQIRDVTNYTIFDPSQSWVGPCTGFRCQALATPDDEPEMFPNILRILGPRLGRCPKCNSYWEWLPAQGWMYLGGICV